MLLSAVVIGVSASAAGAVNDPVTAPAEVEHQQVVLTASTATTLADVPATTDGRPRPTGEVGTTEAMLEGPVLTAESSVDTEVAVVGVSWPGAEPGAVRLRAQTDGQWSPWAGLEVQGAEEVTGTEGDVVLGADAVQVQVRGPQAEVVLDVWGSDPVAQDVAPDQQTRVDGKGLAAPDAIDPETMASSEVNGPIINTRQQWGADESVRKWSPNYIEETKGITLHHTAGVNNYTAAQVPAILRGIYQYHAVTLDWGDVGYNVMVDKFGRAWEGRRGGVDTSLRNAQALGMNYTTAGISILGNYDVTPVPTNGFEAMAAVTAWKLDAHGLDVDSTFRHTNTYEGWTRTLDTVHMHLDVNQTACPGRYFSSRIGEFRTRVGAYQDLGRAAVQRVSGGDRYETAANLAEAAHPWGADTVYLAQGRAIADVLALAPVAARTDGAVLLTGPRGVPDPTLAGLRMLGAERVVVVGGSQVVPESTVRSLRDQGYAVSRISGANRYDTSAELATDWSSASTVYLASGREPADALSGGAAAAYRDAPMMLVDGHALDAPVVRQLTRLTPDRVVLLGGTGRIDPDIVREVRRLLPSADVDRIGGDDRYVTSARVALDTWTDTSSALLANGFAPVDALSGTQLASAQGAPMLLVKQRCMPGVVTNALADLGSHLHTVLGGSGVIDLRAGTNRC